MFIGSSRYQGRMSQPLSARLTNPTNPKPGGSAGYSGEKGKGYQGKNSQDKKSGGGGKYPNIHDYLMSDQNYQSGLSDLEWALQQFKLENQAAKGDLQADFDSAMGYMNFDKDKSHQFMRDDFGARGLVNSGMYPKAVSDYNNEWSMGANDLNRDYSQQVRDLGFEKQNMKQMFNSQKRDLRLDAIRRRAEMIQSKQFNNALGIGGNKNNRKSGRR